MKQEQTQQKIMVLAALALVCGVLYWLNPEPLQKMAHFIYTGDMAGCIAYIRSFGAYAAVVSFLIVVLINCVAVLPNIFMLAVNGIVFGIWEGTLISWAAESVGVIISFVFMRYFFRENAHALIMRSDALQKVEELSGKDGLVIMIVARSIPFVPSGLITAIGAISAISLRDYVIATFIGKLPSAWIEVTLGHDAASYKEHPVRLIALLVVSITAYAGYLWSKKK